MACHRPEVATWFNTFQNTLPGTPSIDPSFYHFSSKEINIHLPISFLKSKIIQHGDESMLRATEIFFTKSIHAANDIFHAKNIIFRALGNNHKREGARRQSPQLRSCVKKPPNVAQGLKFLIQIRKNMSAQGLAGFLKSFGGYTQYRMSVSNLFLRREPCLGTPGRWT